MSIILCVSFIGTTQSVFAMLNKNYKSAISILHLIDTNAAHLYQPVRYFSKNPYQVLGLQSGATTDQINDAHRKLILEWHPDRIQFTAMKKSQEINEARDLLLGINDNFNRVKKSEDRATGSESVQYDTQSQSRSDKHTYEKTESSSQEPLIDQDPINKKLLIGCGVFGIWAILREAKQEARIRNSKRYY